ncbi:hypothetical protein OAG71_04680 [bacterium]|nr:hypothetical protein [bacterium]
MDFAPKHNYEAYNAAVEKELVERPERSIQEKFDQYAEYYDTLMAARHELLSEDASRLDRKMEKIKNHLRVVQIYQALDQHLCNDRESNES